MNRPTSTPSYGPLARHLGLQRQQRDADEISPMITRLQGRAAWLRLFPQDGDAAPTGAENRTVELMSSASKPSRGVHHRGR
jgi:hypothetical protein